MTKRFEIIENICFEIISKLNKELSDRNESKEKNQIRLWKDQDSAINILEKITSIFIKIKQSNDKQRHAEEEPLNETDVRIIMQFCEKYLEGKARTLKNKPKS